MSVPQILTGLAKRELIDILAGLNEPPYRADQIWRWLYVNRVTSWDQMKNLSATLRERLAADFVLIPVTTVKIDGEAGSTRKILVELRDGERVEEVLIPARGRRTVCVSSQAGCKYHCVFCASGQAGFARNLEAGEIVGQFLLAAETYGGKPTHVVFMGIGEPFDNYDAVLKAARIINDNDGLNIGARRITISTCGVASGIERLADEKVQFELSVSLHAPTDELRTRLMPVNRVFPLPRLISACRQYTDATKRIITFEYAMIDGLNDTADMAGKLVALLSPFPCRVNLIPLSMNEEFDCRPSTPQDMEHFAGILEKAGINTTIRASKGTSLRAACGQLRYRRKT